MNFAFVSHVLPPSWSGQAVVIYRLLKGLKPNDYCLISGQTYDTNALDGHIPRLPAHYYQLPKAFQKKIGKVIGINRGFINMPVNFFARVHRIAHIIRSENCKAVVACSGDFYDLPASYLASRLTRAEFYPYIFDYYSPQWPDAKLRLAERFEPMFMKGAAGIIVPNEFMRDELRNLYGVAATVIRNCCDLSLYQSPTGESTSDTIDAVKEEADGDDRDESNGGEARIVYTGDVYEAQMDAFLNLTAALNSLPSSRAKLHLYTAQSPALLAEKGIKGRVVFHEHQSVFAVPAVQKQADVLFLPLAFNSPYPDLIRTSAPGKIGDYLAAQRPILVHAPADSFVAWYFRKYDCGLVVDENDPAKLAEGVERLLGDKDLRERLCENAGERARAEFSDEVARARFAELLKLE